MGGYIGARAGSVGATLANIQDVTATDTSPEVTLINNTHEDTDGGREGKVIFKGQQSGGEESTLAEIQASHDGTSDDEKGDLIFRTNDGSDGASPTERLRIDSAGSIIPTTLGTDNVHLGEGAGVSIASGGDNNVAIGKDAGTAITTGDRNTAVGKDALKSMTTGSFSTAVGYQALENNTGNNNTAVGDQALEANTSGISNTAMGDDALVANTTGDNNVAIGASALDANSTANDNTAVGYNSGTSNTTGAVNVFVGRNAGQATQTTSLLTYVGAYAGANTTGANNTFIGTSAGETITTGANNTVLGRFNGNQHGLDIRTSSNNIVMSDGDGNPRIIVDPSGDVLIGVTSLNYLQDANAVQFKVGDYGQVYVNHASGTANGIFYMAFTLGGSEIGSIKQANSTSINYNTTSDYRLKENVKDISDSITRVKQLQPKRFNFITEPDITCDGFLAHEVSTVVPAAVSGEKDEVQVWDAGEERPDGVSVGDNKLDENGNTIIKPQGIDHSKLVPLLTAALQKAITKIETLETQNTTQATQIADLITRVTALEAE